MHIKTDIHIVVADRSDIMQKHIKRLLNAGGYKNVTLAGNGIEVAKILKTTKVDCIICCWNLPKIRGINILRRIRAMEETKNIPFIMVTAQGNAENMTLAKQHGVSVFIHKPFLPKSFMGAFLGALMKHGLITVPKG